MGNRPRMREFRRAAHIGACVLAMVFGESALATAHANSSAPSPKLSTRDFDRLALANQAAGLALGLVTQRGCRPDAASCIDRATAREIALDSRAATVAKNLLPKLAHGACRRAVAASFTSWNRRESLVRRARSAWKHHDPHAATQAYYYAKWRLDLMNLIAQDC